MTDDDFARAEAEALLAQIMAEQQVQALTALAKLHDLLNDLLLKILEGCDVEVKSD